MSRVKHTAPKRSPRSLKRKVGEPFYYEAIPSDTPEEEQSSTQKKQRLPRRFLNDNKIRRYEELRHWSFLPERRVELKPGECDPFLMGILRRN